SAARLSYLIGAGHHSALVERVDGGLVGALVTLVLSPVGLAGSYIVLVAAAVSCGLLITETSFGTMAGRVRDRSRRIAEIMAEREAARQAAHEAAEAARQSIPMHQPRPSSARRKGLFIDMDAEPAALPAAERDEADDGQAYNAGAPEHDRRHSFRIPGLGLFLRHEPEVEDREAPAQLAAEEKVASSA